MQCHLFDKKLLLCFISRLSPEGVFLDMALSSQLQEKAEECGITFRLDVCGLYKVIGHIACVLSLIRASVLKGPRFNPNLGPDFLPAGL